MAGTARVAAVLLAVGCRATPAPPDVVSGSRLRAIWDVADGARRLAAWHDTQLDLDCGFGFYQHGREHRCLPDVAQAFGSYADPACTEPAASVFTDAPPRYAVIVPDDTCTAETRIFELGDQVVPVYTRDGAGGCVVDPTSSPTYRLGAEVPPTTFVGATEQPDGNQLWLAADDGARIPWAGWDGTRAVAPTHMSDGLFRWAPWIVAYAGLFNTFADAQCTQPAADYLTYIGYCPIDAVLAFTDDICGGTSATFSAVGDPIAAPYHATDTACVQSPVPFADVATLAIGAPIPDDDWPVVDETVIGDGAIGVHYAVLAGMAIGQTGVNIQFGGHGPPARDYFVDQHTGEPCYPATTTDGVTRCVPYYSGSSGYHLDAACTEPVQLVSPQPLGCGGRGGDGIPAYYAESIDGVVHVRPIGAKVAPTTLYLGGSGSCVESPVPDGTEVYATGDELTPDRLVEVTRVVD